MNNISQIIEYLLLGGVLGMLGQGVRVIIGLKKTHDLSSANGKSFKENFDSRQLWSSLLIGFVTGAIGVLTLVSWDKTAPTPCEGCVKGLTIEYKVVMEMIAIG